MAIIFIIIIIIIYLTSVWPFSMRVVDCVKFLVLKLVCFALYLR